MVLDKMFNTICNHTVRKLKKYIQFSEIKKKSGALLISV